jgi:hypothetical protein
MKTSTLPVLLLVAACSPAPQEPVANQTEPVEAEKRVEAVPALAGEWTVSQVNGRPLSQPHPIAANFGEDRLSVRSDCVRMGWAYTQDRNIVSFTSPSDQGCPGRRTGDETEAKRAVTLANIAMFSNDGQEVQLSGAGGSLTMTRS